jgi:superfamily II DNA or RNA helicase
MGKTVCALYIASQLGVKPIILVHKHFLAEQWKARIAQYLGTGVKVSMIQGKTYDTSGDVIIGMLQTFVSRGYMVPPVAGLLIIDECHHIAASVFKRIIWKAPQKFILGLSATPNRLDGLDIYKLLGQPITPGDNLPDVVTDCMFSPPPPPPPPRYSANKVTVLTYPYYAPRYLTETPPLSRSGEANYVAMVSTLTEDKARTSRIVDLVESHELIRCKDTLILSHRRAHCEALHAECIKRGLDAALFLAPKSRKKNESYAPPTNTIIISTYAYVSEAFDVQRLECLVMATPASSIEQACGRVMRKMDDPTHRPVVVDFVDKWSLFNAQASKRMSFFRNKKFCVMNILPDLADRVPPAEREKSKLLFVSD